ncbi:hypothetical protein Fmac_009686 [Flemingia macrophylla]|uniref:Uncharacterized protein n=1 Tax=Flemingia macrophylla TaxID=520843 RepID=A0ABD1N1I5_9FABA
MSKNIQPRTFPWKTDIDPENLSLCMRHLDVPFMYYLKIEMVGMTVADET